jgi:toxin ParE1/3/4
LRVIRITQRAQRDLAETLGFIAEDNAAAASRIATRVRQAARRLAEFPLLGVDCGQGRRVVTIGGTKLRLVYRVTATEVVILHIWHGARQWPPA